MYPRSETSGSVWNVHSLISCCSGANMHELNPGGRQCDHLVHISRRPACVLSMVPVCFILVKAISSACPRAACSSPPINASAYNTVNMNKEYINRSAETITWLFPIWMAIFLDIFYATPAYATTQFTQIGHVSKASELCMPRVTSPTSSQHKRTCARCQTS